MYTYSAKNNAFYPTSMRNYYEIQRQWPHDGIEVSTAIFIEFTGLAPSGKQRCSDDKGLPCWVDIPPPTYETQVASAESQRQMLIDQANRYMNSKQWSGKAAIGRLKDDELVQYNLWLDCLDALEAVDTSNAPDIEWPSIPAD